MKKPRVITIAVGALAAAVIGLCWQPIVAWYRLYSRFESIGRNEQGLPEYRHRQTGVVMVRVPGGTLTMGSPEDDTDEDDGERPQREVTLGPFLIAKYEIRQAEWQGVMRSNPSRINTEKPNAFGLASSADLPVEMVSWKDCQEFCKRTGFSLPSEGQWEYACRTGTTSAFAFGETLNPDQANFYDGERPPDVTVRVDSNRPNAFGLHNMHGNVWEWCRDTQPERPGLRALRGGSFADEAARCRSEHRSHQNEDFRGADVGLRPVFLLR